MSKTQKELAFLRDLYVKTDWTERFTNAIDGRLNLPKKGKMLFVNAGTGDYALALREKLKNEVAMHAVADNSETLKIARAKTEAVKADISFETLNDASSGDFDEVLADASLIAPAETRAFLGKIIGAAKNIGGVTFFLPTAGSFGEIFSYLWETFLDADLMEKGAEIERLITEIPTVSKVEEIAESFGLKEIETQTKNEIFEYKDGAEFINSTLVQDFLLPVWLDFLSEKERKKVAKKLAEIIDAGRDGLSFRFSVKATLVTGEKEK